jgi:predicted nucleotidyltransferase
MASFVEEREARRSARREQLSRALDQVVAGLKALGAIRIVVFGSYVEGRLRTWSDLDVLAVMPPSRSGAEWFRVVGDAVDTDVPVDILTFTPDELEEAVGRSSFVRRALRTGRVVHG